MIRAGRVPRLRAVALVLLLAFLAFSCGSTGPDFAGGGTGGTGISTGSITAFGSVVVNGVHFKTDDDVAPGFRTKKMVNGSEDRSGRPDREVFSPGMVVTVRHGAGDTDASAIEYRNNLLGPVGEKVEGTDNVILVLGHGVVVDNGVFFGLLKPGDTVEVSGFADEAGRIRANRIFQVSPSVKEYEVKGFVSGRNGNSFRIGALPEGRGATVGVSYGGSAVSGLPGGPVDGMYVQVVTTDPVPDNGVLFASRITKLAARTEFPEQAAVALEGLITVPRSGQGNDLSFAVEGKRVQWDAGTKFYGGAGDDLRQANVKVEIQGTENGGVLSVARIVFR
jgi:hypothetical protein